MVAFAKTGGSGVDHPFTVQWLTRMRHPWNAGELRTKYRSPVSGSKAAWDSNCGLEMPAGFHGITVDSTAGAAPGARSAAARIGIRRDFMNSSYRTMDPAPTREVE